MWFVSLLKLNSDRRKRRDLPDVNCIEDTFIALLSLQEEVLDCTSR